MEELNRYLQSKLAYLVNVQQISNGSIQIWSVQNKLIMVRKYLEGGFEIYVPVSDSNSIKESIFALDSWLNS